MDRFGRAICYCYSFGTPNGLKAETANLSNVFRAISEILKQREKQYNHSSPSQVNMQEVDFVDLQLDC